MQGNTWMFALGVVVIVLGGYFFVTKDQAVEEATTPPMHEMTDTMSSDMPGMVMPDESGAMMGSIKEFTITAYYDETGKWFSLKEMSVKKGDTVRVHITNTKGMHDFTIDEFGVKKSLPLNEEVAVEFTASKTGDFVYYCSMPGHRSGGQWGTLHVME